MALATNDIFNLKKAVSSVAEAEKLKQEATATDQQRELKEAVSKTTTATSSSNKKARQIPSPPEETETPPREIKEPVVKKPLYVRADESGIEVTRKDLTSKQILQTKQQLAEEGVTPETVRDFKYIDIGGKRFYPEPAYEGLAHGQTFVVEDISTGEKQRISGSVYNAIVQHATITGVKSGMVQARWDYQLGNQGVPSSVSEQIQVPEAIKAANAEREYIRLAYEVSLGIKSKEQADREFANILEGKVEALPDTDTVGGEFWYYQKYGGVKLKPGETLERRDGQLVVVSKELREYEKHESQIYKNISGEAGPVKKTGEMFRFWSTGFTPENFLYTKTIGTLLFGGGSAKQNVNKAVKEYAQITHKLDKEITGSPQEKFQKFVIKSYSPGGFGFMGTIAALTLGVGPAAAKAGPVVASSVRAGQVVVGTVLADVAVTDIYKTFQKETQRQVPLGTTSQKILTLGTSIAFMAAVGTVARGEPIPIKPKPKYHVYSEGGELSYRKYYDVIGKKVYVGDKYYMQPWQQGNIKGMGVKPSSVATPTTMGGRGSITNKILLGETIKTSPIVHTSVLQFQELFKTAKQTNTGLFKPSEVKSVYKPSELEKLLYKTSEFKRPEDITIMPHKIPESITYVFNTKVGTKYYTVAKDKSFYSVGDIQPLSTKTVKTVPVGRGKKGGKIYDPLATKQGFNMFVSGETYYKVYTASSGPLGVIPSVKKTLTHGIVKSQEMPLPEGADTDLIGIKSVGSFKISKPSKVKSLALYDEKQLFSFQDRLLRETHITESVTISKKLGGQVSTPTKYGLKTKETPDYTLGFTKTFMKGKGTSTDVSLTMYPPKPKKDYSGGKLGFDTMPPDGATKTDIVMPSGFGTQLQKTSFPQLFKSLNSFYSGRTVTQYSANMDTGDVVNVYWKGVSPSYRKPVDTTINIRQPTSKPKPMDSTMLIQQPKTKTGLKQQPTIKTDINILNTQTILQQNISNQGLKNIQNVLNINTTKTAQSPTSIQNIVLENKQMNIQMQKQSLQLQTIQMQVTPTIQTILMQTPKTTTTTTTTTKTTTTKKPPRIFLFDLPSPAKKMMGDMTGKTSYHVMVKKRQWKDGKRIRGTEWKKITKKPLSKNQALRLGAKIADNSAKASFKLVPSDEKPTRHKGKLPSILTAQLDFYEKSNNLFIEKNINRIDSPGELREITYRGHAARRAGKGNKKKKSKDIINNNVYKKMLKGFKI